VFGIRGLTSTTKTWSATSNLIGGTVANSIQNNSSSSTAQVVGMQTGNPISTLTTNTVRNLTASGGTGTATSASVIGIYSSSPTTNQIIRQNTIYNLNNSNTTAATTVTGIQFTGSTNNLVQKNFIYNLTSATNSTTASVNGIVVSGGTSTYSNNMIVLGSGISNSIGAVPANTSATGINGILGSAVVNNFWYNSIYIGGTSTAGSGASYAFNLSVGTTTARSFRNNIFVNARTNGGTATGKHYAIKLNELAANPTGLTINNNLYD
jgi:hypothetical protein